MKLLLLALNLILIILGIEGEFAIPSIPSPTYLILCWLIGFPFFSLLIYLAIASSSARIKNPAYLLIWSSVWAAFITQISLTGLPAFALSLESRPEVQVLATLYSVYCQSAYTKGGDDHPAHSRINIVLNGKHYTLNYAANICVGDVDFSKYKFPVKIILHEKKSAFATVITKFDVVPNKWDHN